MGWHGTEGQRSAISSQTSAVSRQRGCDTEIGEDTDQTVQVLRVRRTSLARVAEPARPGRRARGRAVASGAGSNYGGTEVTETPKRRSCRLRFTHYVLRSTHHVLRITNYT